MPRNGNAPAVLEHDTRELVLEQLPNGEHAWLRPVSSAPTSYQLPPDTAAAVDELFASPYRDATCSASSGRLRCQVTATRLVAYGKPTQPNVELLCVEHADGRAARDQVLLDQPLADPTEAPVETVEDEQPHKSAGSWRAGWQYFTFICPTTYTLFAPDLEAARAWFTDKVDIDIECGPMEFGTPTLVAIETSDGMPVELPVAAPAPDGDELTSLGRRVLAEVVAFGECPTVAEAFGLTGGS